MSNYFKLYIYSSVIIAGFIYIAQKVKVSLPAVINNYVNDFLIVPICLTVCLNVLRYTRNNKTYQLPLYLIFYLCFCYSVLFEYVLPKYYERYTSDWIDVGLYFASGFVFHALQKIKT